MSSLKVERHVNYTVSNYKLHCRKCECQLSEAVLGNGCALLFFLFQRYISLLLLVANTGRPFVNCSSAIHPALNNGSSDLYLFVPQLGNHVLECRLKTIHSEVIYLRFLPGESQGLLLSIACGN